MSLNYDFTKCSDEGKEFLRQNSNAWNLSTATISTGINQITEDNFEKFWERYCIVQYCGNEHLYFTKEDAKRCIGLSTNASPLTDAAFKKWNWELLTRIAPKAVKLHPILATE